MVRQRTGIAIVVVMLLGVFGLLGCSNPNPIKRIETETGIEMPKNMETLYSHQDTHFGHGRKLLFAVFQFDDTPSEFLDRNEFQGHESLTYWKDGVYWEESHICVMRDNYIEIGIPKEFLTPYEGERLWLSVTNSMNDSTLFLYFTETRKLIVHMPGT